MFGFAGAVLAHLEISRAERHCDGEIRGRIIHFYIWGGFDETVSNPFCAAKAQLQKENNSFVVEYWRYREPGAPDHIFDFSPKARQAAINFFEDYERPLTDISDGAKLVPKDFDFCKGFFLAGSAAYRFDYLAVHTEGGKIGVVRPHKSGLTVCGILKGSINETCSNIKILAGGKLAACQKGAASRLINIPSEFIYHDRCHTIKFLGAGEFLSCELGAQRSFIDIETERPVSFAGLPARIQEEFLLLEE